MFNSISKKRPKLNKFDLSHDKKLSCNMGDLIPVLTQEVVPGDRFKVSSEIMLRLAPMLAPIMHRVHVYTHYFFVPNRIIWNEWEDFITGGEDGLQQPVAPYISSVGLQQFGRSDAGSLADYLGLPEILSQASPVDISALPFRAYTEIYNEYYRDQNLTSPVDFAKTSGQLSLSADIDKIVALRKRAWEKDYFTSALPWAQRGDAVSVPGSFDYLTHSLVYDESLGVNYGNTKIAGTSNPTAAGAVYGANPPSASPDPFVRIENLEGVEIDINDLRRSNALQRWLELAARGGSRYVEQIKAFFGVTSSDARLQRPEYLGGGRQNVMISEVLQTAETATTPQGNMAGHGVSVGATNSFSKSFEEHGFVIGIMSVLPRTAYQQGINRLWSRDDKFDYYFPQFAHLGEQEVLNKELFFEGDALENPDDTFGYQSRYAEYKYGCDTVHGDFKDTLDYWHMGRKFTSAPNLNTSFIESDPTHRIFANTTPTDHKLWVQIYNQFSALRPMPYFADPRL